MSARRVFILEQALKKFIAAKNQSEFMEASLEAQKLLEPRGRKHFEPEEKITESEVYTKIEAIIRMALDPSGPWQTRDLLAGIGMTAASHTDRVHAGLILKAAGFSFVNRYDKNRKMPVKKWVIRWEYKKADIQYLVALAKEKYKEKIPADDKPSRSKFENLI